MHTMRGPRSRSTMRGFVYVPMVETVGPGTSFGFSLRRTRHCGLLTSRALHTTGTRGRSGARPADPVGAAAVAGRDVRLANHVGTEELAKQLELGAASGRRISGDAVDPANALDERDHPTRPVHHLAAA